MPKYYFLFLIVLSLAFTADDGKIFKSADQKIMIAANNSWVAAGNMNGIEIFISRENPKSGIPAVITVSKDENLLEDTDLNKYSAGKIFLQISPLKTSPSISSSKSIDGKNFKYYEYEYNNKDLIKMKTLVFHTLIGTTGYQMTITADDASFETKRPLYNEIWSSLQITQ